MTEATIKAMEAMERRMVKNLVLFVGAVIVGFFWLRKGGVLVKILEIRRAPFIRFQL